MQQTIECVLGNKGSNVSQTWAANFMELAF